MLNLCSRKRRSVPVSPEVLKIGLFEDFPTLSWSVTTDSLILMFPKCKATLIGTFACFPRVPFDLVPTLRLSNNFTSLVFLSLPSGSPEWRLWKAVQHLPQTAHHQNGVSHQSELAWPIKHRHQSLITNYHCLRLSFSADISPSLGCTFIEKGLLLD